MGERASQDLPLKKGRVKEVMLQEGVGKSFSYAEVETKCLRVV